MKKTGKDGQTTYYAGINGAAMELPMMQQVFVYPSLVVGGIELITWVSQLVSGVITPPDLTGVQGNNATATVFARHVNKKAAAIIDVHTRFMSFSVNSRGANEALEDELAEALNWDTCIATANQNFNTSHC
jgi:hypothetical protein